MTHDDLARDLADSLRSEQRMVWCDMQLGPSGSPRPDVYAMYKSYSQPQPTAYEVKVTAADFRADVTAGKWQTYLAFAQGVYFACRSGLITKDAVPARCGLIVRGPVGWKVARRPVLSPVTVPEPVWLKLLIDGVEREGPRYRARAFSDSAQRTAVRERFGELVAQTVRDRLAVEHEIQEAQLRAEHTLVEAQRAADRVRAEAEKVAPLREELCAVLGLQPTAGRWELEAGVARIRRSLEEHPAERQLQRFTQAVRWALERDGYKEPVQESV